jgi:hypothetical protein
MAKRRLPVVASTNPEDDSDPKPHWQWVAFGAVATLVVWIPLAYFAQRLGARAPEQVSLLLGVALHVLALGVASAVGGYLVAHYAPLQKRPIARMILLGALAPTVAAGFAVMLSMFMGLVSLALVVLPVAFASGWLGAWRGGKSRALVL